MSQLVISKKRAEMFADLLQMEMAVGETRIRGNRRCTIDFLEGLLIPMQLRARAAKEWQNGDAMLYVQSLGKLRFLFAFSKKKSNTVCLVLNVDDLQHDNEKLLQVSKMEYLFDIAAAGFQTPWAAARAKFEIGNTGSNWEPIE